MKAAITNIGKLLEKKQKYIVVLILLQMIFGALLESACVGMMVPLVSVILDSEAYNSNAFIDMFCNFLQINSYKEFLVISICLLIFIYLFKGVYMMLEYYVQYRFATGIRRQVQRKLLHNYLLKPYSYFLNVESGEIVTTIRNDVEGTFVLFSTILEFFTEIIVSFFLLITVFLINPYITLITGIILGIVMLFVLKVVKPKFIREGEKYQKYSSACYKWLLQSINGIKDIKVSNTEEYFECCFDVSNKKYVEANRKYSTYSNVPRLIIEMSAISGVLLVILVTVLKDVDLVKVAPALTAFAVAAVKLLPSANRISSAFNNANFYKTAMEKVVAEFDSISRQNGIEKENVLIEKKIEVGRIEVNNVRFSYPNSDKVVLDGVSMIIPSGSSVGIVGPSGSGKTTLVDILLGLLKPVSGEVICGENNIDDIYNSWLSQIGYIPQNIYMMDGTIRENVAFGVWNDEVDDKQVWDALDAANLGDFVRSLPEGLDATIGENGVRISGGQRQRIGIARALYRNPQVLFFDEATSALDNETESAIMESINSLKGKKTLIIIAHRLTTIEQCDMVYKVEHGIVSRER